MGIRSLYRFIAHPIYRDINHIARNDHAGMILEARNPRATTLQSD